MRIAATLAVSLLLSGCVTGGNDLEDALRLTEAEDDAHCRSLLIQPGEGNRLRALQAVEQAIEAVRTTPEPCARPQ